MHFQVGAGQASTGPKWQVHRVQRNVDFLELTSELRTVFEGASERSTFNGDVRLFSVP